MTEATEAPLRRDLADFRREDRRFDGVSKPVLRIGDRGPGVLVIHEIFGFTPAVARLCRWISAAGFRVHAPILLGTPDTDNREKVTLGRVLGLCISREFTLFAGNRSSPVVDWLKPLARAVHAECGGAGVGVVGMCLTGGFALSMAVDPSVMAPVLSQPSLPLLDHAALPLTKAELAVVKARVAEGLTVRGYRFAGDTLARQGRFDRLDAELGHGFAGTVLPDSAGNPKGFRAQGKPPHSVLTGDLIDAGGEPTRHAVDEIIAFFAERLSVPQAQRPGP